MQKYSDVINELKSSEELCAQLEVRCAEKSTELDQTKATLEENQQAFDVTILHVSVLLHFLPRDAMLVRCMLSSCVRPSVRMPVCLSACHTPVLYQNG